MPHYMGNPATLAACGVPVTDLAGASITPENIPSRPLTQAEAWHWARAVFGCEHQQCHLTRLSRGATGIRYGIRYWRAEG